jgi:hypothetical protein
LEAALTLQPYAIVSTPGMQRDHDSVPAGTPKSGANRSSKVATELRFLLKAIAVVAGVSGLAAFVAALFYGANP